MEKPILNSSSVIFIEEGHKYTLGDKSLSGITSLLHRVLYPSMYANVPESTLIAAAQRGTTIHKMIEEYHVNGIDFGDAELNDYLNLMVDYIDDWVESEYLVSDNERYASKIDLVYFHDGKIILSDIKTVSKMDRQYMEYCSWQLSVYAYLFELQNPYLNVGGLSVVWLPKSENGEPKLIEVERKSNDMIENLFELDDAKEQLAPTIRNLHVSEKLQNDALAAFLQLSILKKRYEDIKYQLYQIMKENGILEATLGDLKLSITKAYTKQQLDTKRLKEEEPLLFKKYTKAVYVDESLKVTLKNKQNATD